MKKRYILFFVTASIFNLICWFYIIVFCGIYKKTTSGWVNGIYVGFLMDWFCISVAIPILKSVLRVTARAFPKLRFIVFIEHLFWLSALIG